MEKCCESDNINIIVSVKESAKSVERMCSCLWLTNIKGNLRFNIFPLVDNSVVHMNRVPHNVSKETYRILVERCALVDCYIARCLVISPIGRSNNLTCCAVDNLPPSCDVVTVVDLEHIGIKMIHKMNFKS